MATRSPDGAVVRRSSSRCRSGTCRLRVTAVDGAAAARRRSSGPCSACRGRPRRTRPGPRRLRGYEDPALARKVRGLARGFPGVCGVFVQDLRTGAGAAWNARARFPGRVDAEARDRGRAPPRRYAIPAPGIEAREPPLADARLLGRPRGERAARGDRRLDLRRLGPREHDDAGARHGRQRHVRRLHRRGLRARALADPARDLRPPVLHRQGHDRLGHGPPRARTPPGRRRAGARSSGASAALSSPPTHGSSSTCSRTRARAGA